MSRINSLLRTSLEAHEPVTQIDPLASLEGYMEYRAALEEYEEAADVQSQIENLAEGLIEIEGVIDESRNDNDLTEDQVKLQVDAVNAVRAVIDGDVSEISMESFDSILSASLEASDKSNGLLKRMWDGFVAMLVKIKEAFKKMFAWITGSKKRAEAATKTVEEAAKEVKKDAEPVDKNDAEEVKVVAEVTKTVKAAESVKEASSEIKEVMTEAKKIAAEATSKNGIASSPETQKEYTAILKSMAIANSLMGVVAEKGDAVNFDEKSLPSDFIAPDKGLERIAVIMREYTLTAGQVTDTIAILDDSIDSMTKMITSGKMVEGLDPEDAKEEHQSMRKYVKRIQDLRGLLANYLKTGDRLASKASEGANKVVKKHRSKKQRRADAKRRSSGAA